MTSPVSAALKPATTTATTAGKGSYGLQAPTTTSPEKARLPSRALPDFPATTSSVASTALHAMTESGPRRTRGPHTSDASRRLRFLHERRAIFVLRPRIKLNHAEQYRLLNMPTDVLIASLRDDEADHHARKLARTEGGKEQNAL